MRLPTILVVGATGQLGLAIVRKLRAQSFPVAALARLDSRTEPLTALGVELRTGDLLDPASLARACQGIDAIVSSANAALPRKRHDSFRGVDIDGHATLIAEARKCGMKRFVYISVCATPGKAEPPIFRAKRAVEQKLKSSGVPFTILRATAFMDLVFAMMGSDLPLRGEVAHSAERPFWFTRKFFASVRNDAAQGRLGVVGSGNTRHSFICVDDVAEFAVRSLREPWARDAAFEIGGPEPLSQREVAALYGQILNKEMRVKSTPAIVFRVMRTVLAPFSEAAANIAALNLHTATMNGIVPDAGAVAARFGIELTSAEQFLRKKAGSR